MLNKEARIKEIQNSKGTNEYKSIFYKDENRVYQVKEIPLSALIYNKYNGRIRSSVLSFESTLGKLDPEKEYDKEIIEQYLFDSARQRNEKTIESLLEKGQQEVGIVTKDGVIVDGNRRALLLNYINKNYNRNLPFKAIVLTDVLEEKNRNDILLLETSYQMGVDSKVDYGPIEKYLRCKELISGDNKMNIDGIANLMAETPKKIEEWLCILNLMEEYLKSIGTPNLYTRLDKREGHFVDLNSYLKSYISRKSNSIHWGYSNEDIDQMKKIYFDFIRLKIPVLRARIISRTGASGSFFSNQNIWRDFVIEHEKIVNSYTEDNFNSIKSTSPTLSNEDVYRELDKKWTNNLETRLIENLDFTESEFNDINRQIAPFKILKRVLNNLGQIDLKVLEANSTHELERILSLINERVETMVKTLSNTKNIE